MLYDVQTAYFGQQLPYMEISHTVLYMSFFSLSVNQGLTGTIPKQLSLLTGLTDLLLRKFSIFGELL